MLRFAKVGCYMYIRVQLCWDVDGTSFLDSDSENGILGVNPEYVVRSEWTCLVSNFSLCSPLSEFLPCA